MLAATLTAGMVPVTALAQDEGVGAAPAAAATAAAGTVATGAGVYLGEGKADPVPVSWF